MSHPELTSHGKVLKNRRVREVFRVNQGLRVYGIDSAILDLFSENDPDLGVIYTAIFRCALDGYQLVKLLAVVSHLEDYRDGILRSQVIAILTDICPMLAFLIEKKDNKLAAENVVHHMGDIREVFMYFLKVHGAKYVSILNNEHFASIVPHFSFSIVSAADLEDPGFDLADLKSNDIKVLVTFFDNPVALKMLEQCLVYLIENKYAQATQAQQWFDYLQAGYTVDQLFLSENLVVETRQQAGKNGLLDFIRQYFDNNFQWRQHQKKIVRGGLNLGNLKEVTGTDGKVYYVPDLLLQSHELRGLQDTLEAAVPNLPQIVALRNPSFSLPYTFGRYQNGKLGGEYVAKPNDVVWNSDKIAHMVPVLRWIVDPDGQRIILGSEGTLNLTHPLQQLDSSLSRPDEIVPARYDLLLGLLVLLYLSPEIHTKLPKMLTTERADGSKATQRYGTVQALIEVLRPLLNAQLAASPALQKLEKLVSQ